MHLLQQWQIQIVGTIITTINADRGNHYGQRVNFKRGERLPSEFRSKRYVVSNYRYHRLYQPPRGYNWMQVQGKYVLVDSKYRVYRIA